jgi:hypothetical protein
MIAYSPTQPLHSSDFHCDFHRGIDAKMCPEWVCIPGLEPTQQSTNHALSIRTTVKRGLKMTQNLFERMDAQAIETLVPILGYPLPVTDFLAYLQEMGPKQQEFTLEDAARAYVEHVRSKKGMKTQELAETLAEKLQSLLSALQDVPLPVEATPAYDAASKALDEWHRNLP